MSSKQFEEAFPDVSIIEYKVSRDEYPVVSVSAWTKDKNLSNMIVKKFRKLFLAHVVALRDARDDKAMSHIRYKLDHAGSKEEQEALRRELLEYQEQLMRHHADYGWTYKE